MKGSFHVVVQNNRLHYEFDLKRNITVIRGDSATGKTTLIELVRLRTSQGESSGVYVRCEKECRTLPEADWRVVLPLLHDQIIFLDENNSFVRTKEFAEAVKASDCWFVIVTREDYPMLPYSVDEIYGIHVSGKYRDLKRTYNEFYHIYPLKDRQTELYPDKVITEDANAGFQFFQGVSEKAGIVCEAAKGKSRIIDTLRAAVAAEAGAEVLVIADGAAIGPEMTDLWLFLESHPHVHLYLPESFEWIILASGLIDGNAVQEILAHPEEYIESRVFFSWERYFTKILIDETKGTYLSYTKSALNPCYLQHKESAAILKVIEPVHLEKHPADAGD